MNFNLALPFYESSLRTPGAQALDADNVSWTYQQLVERVSALTEHFRQRGEAPRRVGILGSRSADACVSILAASWAGATYVPINIAVPEEARAELIKRSALDVLVADMQGSALLTETVLSKSPASVIGHRKAVPHGSHVTDWNSIPPASSIKPPVQVEASHPGYILYTSGTTGTPKGVMVPAGAVAHLLEVMQEKYPVRAEDRVAETTATSFDLSVYNMFVTWKAGASLHIVPFSQTLAPARFIIEHEVSVWLSVPSVANLLSRAKLLHPGVFPSLRLTFFAGEPLLAEMAAEWQAATRNSVVANLYGPTEATVVCLGQDYSNKCVLTRDSVGIGQCLRGTDARILSPENTWQRDGEPGELLLSGSQLALGYLDDPEKTTAKFVQLDGVRWYKTGDLAMRDSSGFFHFLGRIDNQVKIMGFRVELEDIEFYLRKVTGCEAVCAIPWPYHNGSAAGVIAFIGSPIHDAAATKEELRKYLPNYFVPSQIRRLDELPTNTNGKIDRSVLQERLQRECTD